jgi:hypothetical protein
MKHVIATTALAATLGIFGAAAAQAGVGDGIASANIGGALIAQVENAQFFFGGQNYCWYDQGWRGPGWYWCGYAWRSGFGWGGGEGFHGWSRQGRGVNNRSFDHRTFTRGPMGGPKGPMMGGPKGPMGGPKGPMGGHPGKKWP